jgi:uncharacterized protein (TIGR03067 family)
MQPLLSNLKGSAAYGPALKSTPLLPFWRFTMLRQAALALAIGLLFAGFGSSGVAGDSQEEAFKKELKAMAGTWRPVAAEVDGLKAPEERLKESVVTRDEAGNLVARRGDKIIMEGTVKKINATKKPKTIDSEITAGDNKGKTILGIYELEGDTLRICVVLPGKGERPTEFSAGAGSGCALTVYKREKK